ncbi:MAG: TatD family hydrolase [Oscillospiraceae bacterium]|nr:TatD family hydrolase [Oscillospiraceae bacterium]
MDENLLIFDSHAHYTDSAFDTDREALLEKLPQEGVMHCIVCGTQLADSAAAAALAERYPSLLSAAVGVHPECPAPPDGYSEQLRKMAAHPCVRAIGEIGLDYHYEGYDKAVQQRILREQLALAQALSLPVILHCREATGDMLTILREFAPLSGVMHCFSGSVETAREVLQMGLYLGFNGVITFKNARKPLEVIRFAPTDRLLLETDCPYLAPVPFRGRRCDSTMIAETAAVMAREKGISRAEICRITAQNAIRLFRCEKVCADPAEIISAGIPES